MLASRALRPRRSVNFARRQQYRRLMRAAMASAGCAGAAMLGLLAAGAGAATLGGLLLFGAVALGMYARRWLVLAGRSRVGAHSEDEVQRALARSRVKAGGCATRCRGADAGTSTRSRSLPPAWHSWWRPRPEPTRTGTLRVCASRRHGCRVAGGDGASAVRCRSSASLDAAGSSLSRTECWWCRSTGLRRRCAPPPVCELVRASCGETAPVAGLTC
jgi:hypothetical protein